MSTRVLNSRRSRKGQVQMLESIGVIILVTFLIFMGISMYQRYSTVAFKQKLAEQNQLDAVEVVKRVLDLPELQCSSVDVVSIGCMDLLKVRTFASFSGNATFREYYYPLLRDSRIVIREVYPTAGNVTLYENNATTNTEKPFFVPILLADPFTGGNAFAVLEVTVFT